MLPLVRHIYSVCEARNGTNILRSSEELANRGRFWEGHGFQPCRKCGRDCQYGTAESRALPKSSDAKI